ncbi:MAG: chloride channel protein [Rhodospirillales bacterium]|nr:chloride channel protein [Rhodospirillales bacterium]MDE2318682.1 chloride channel protein [Rhodospirillales bacterium]
MGIVVGTGGVVAAWALLRLIAFGTSLAYWGHFGGVGAAPAHLPVWTIAVPAVGGLAIGLMARYGSEKIRGHGIPEALEAIVLGGSRMGLKVAILKPISSAISIGTGGPFGAEGPIIMTGGAIGSLFAQFFALTNMERKTLLVAGACAGMTAIFGTPVAAMLLAIELLLFELKPRSFLPVAAACITAALERNCLLTPAPLFPFIGGVTVNPIHGIGWVGLGLATGFGSALLTITVYAAEDWFMRRKLHWMWWPALGGLLVGLGGLVDPRALGVGYPDIAQMLTGGLVGLSALRLMVVKAVIWSVALGSGTSGGVLAPLLIIGGGLGAVLAPWLPAAAPGFWAVLGMAAMMGGTMRAPLTATLFAVELTGNHEVLLPVITACMASYAVTVLVMRRSILTEKLARRGHHITREYSIDSASLARVREIMATPVETLSAATSVGDAIAFFLAPSHRHRSYPVVDEEQRLVGLVSRADILDWIGAQTPPTGCLAEILAKTATPSASPSETISAVAVRMMVRRAPRIPVVDPETRKLVGMISRGDLIKLRWKEFEAETVREAHFKRKRKQKEQNIGHKERWMFNTEREN